MVEPAHLTVEQAQRIHAAVLREHGGSDGLRDRALLESAVAAPQATMFGKPLLADSIEMAAAYLFYLCCNHPFADGNKRTALAACLVFLRANDMQPSSDNPAWEALVLDVAAGRLDRDQTTARLRKLITRRPK